MFKLLRIQKRLSSNPRLSISWNWTKTDGAINFLCFRFKMSELFQNNCYNLNKVEQSFFEKSLNLTNIETVKTVRTDGQKYGLRSPTNYAHANDNQYEMALDKDFLDSLLIIYIYDRVHLEKKIVPMWKDKEIPFKLKRDINFFNFSKAR